MNEHTEELHRQIEMLSRQMSVEEILAADVKDVSVGPPQPVDRVVKLRQLRAELARAEADNLHGQFPHLHQAVLLPPLAAHVPQPSR